MYIVAYVLIAIGALMTVVGFLGCCGAYQESACLLGTVSSCARQRARFTQIFTRFSHFTQIFHFGPFSHF